MRFVGIDPSTKTGFVALDERLNVLVAKELKGIGNKDPKRMVTLIENVSSFMEISDYVCIEGMPFSTQKAITTGGIHHGIRNELFKSGIGYREVAPNAVKKYVSVTGWKGEAGNKKRLTGKEKKLAVMDAAKQHFGFINKSDNIVDAYIIARIGLNLYMLEQGLESMDKEIYQLEVLHSILNKE